MPAYLSEGSLRFKRNRPDNPAAKLDYYLGSSSVSSLTGVAPLGTSWTKSERSQADAQVLSCSSGSATYTARLDHNLATKKNPAGLDGSASGAFCRRRATLVRPYVGATSSGLSGSSAIVSSASSENFTMDEKTSLEHFARPSYQIDLQKSNQLVRLSDRPVYGEAKGKSLSSDSVNNKLSSARVGLFIDRLGNSRNRVKGRNVNKLNRRFLVRGEHLGDPYALSELFSQSEIPGFREIFASDSYLRKFCWIVAFLVMTVLSLNDTIELIAEYYNYPITVDVRHRDSARLPFPAVTVCNLNVVRFSALCSSSVSGSRQDLAGQIPSELRDRLCGIQVDKKNTTDSDINDINNIGITTSATTSNSESTSSSLDNDTLGASLSKPTIGPPGPNTDDPRLTGTTDALKSTYGLSSSSASADGSMASGGGGGGGAQGGGRGASTAGSSSTARGSSSSIASTLASVVSTASNQASSRRSTAAGGLDLGDFAMQPMPAMNREPLGQMQSIRTRRPAGARKPSKRSIKLADQQRPFASQRLPIKIGSSTSTLPVFKPDGPSRLGLGAVSSAQIKYPAMSQFNKPSAQTNRLPAGSPTSHNVKNAPAPASNPLAPFSSQSPSGHSGSGHQTTAANFTTTTFSPPIVPEEFELTERQERELQENLTNWLAVMYNRDSDLTRSLGHQFNDMILRCTMKSINCTHQRSFETSFSPTEGNCFTYRSRVKRRPASPRSSQEFEDANLAGTSQGLELVLNLEKGEYISGSSQVGALVMVHHPSDLSYAASEATFVAPEFTTYIGIKMVNITRLPYPYPEHCIDSWPSKFADTSTQNSTYSQQACLKICLQKTIQSHCQCQSAFLPVVEVDGQAVSPSGSGAMLRPTEASTANQTSTWPSISLASSSSSDNPPHKSQQTRIIICDTRKVTTRQCVREVMFRAADRVHKCDCPPKCRIVRYDKTVSMARWPTKEDKVTFDRGKLDVNFQNLAKVIVYFQTMTCEEVTQQAVFNAAKLFSSLGGVMGMYVGFSFLSVFEIFEVMSRKIWHHFIMRLSAGNNPNRVVRRLKRRS